MASVTDKAIIKGRIISAGRIITCDNYPQGFADDINFETVDGLLIEMPREAVAAAAGTMFGKEIEVRLAGLQDANVNLIEAALKYRNACKAWVENPLADREKSWNDLCEAQKGILKAAEALP